jgi:hypothetical protein
MSDFSGLEQSFALASIPPAAVVEDFASPVSTELQPHEVGFRRLRGHREIAGVQHLRQQIALPASAVGDAGFVSREKKETKSGL